MDKKLPWLVIPGGPGLSNKYLKHTLPKAFMGYNLHFYDAYGSPESEKKDVCIEEMVEQIKEEISDLKSSTGCGLITHSFGNYLALRLLEQQDNRLKALIMLNPIPFVSTDWKVALNNIVKKIPLDVFEEIRSLSEQPDQGETFFRLIYPYYIGSRTAALPLEVPFDSKACNLIASKVADFNDVALIYNSRLPMIRIVGELDSFYTDGGAMSNSTLVLKEVGHYPFLEDPLQFIDTVGKIGEKVKATV